MISGALISGGIMAAIAAFMLFKIADNNRAKEKDGKDDGGLNRHNALQILFFFMVVASLIIVGKAGLDSAMVCDFLMDNQTVNGNVTTYEYDYVCEDTTNNNNVWAYKLPLWLGYMAGLYLIIYFLIIIWNMVKEILGRGERHE